MCEVMLRLINNSALKYLKRASKAERVGNEVNFQKKSTIFHIYFLSGSRKNGRFCCENDAKTLPDGNGTCKLSFERKNTWKSGKIFIEINLQT